MPTYNAADQAGTNWLEDYASLLLSFDRSAVGAAIKSFFRTEMSDDIRGAEENEIYIQICCAFTKLYLRGAIKEIRPLSTEGARMLDELLGNFNIVPGPVEEDESLTLREQVIQDWNTIGMDAFKKKRQADSKYEAMYARLAESGDIR